jgi:acetyl-CoA acyltransferase 1
MGVGPVYAIPLALKNSGLDLSDVDLFEVRNHNTTLAGMS